MSELEVYLHKGFLEVFRTLSPDLQRLVLDLLARLRDREKLEKMEPNRRYVDPEHGEVCLVYFEAGFVLAYCVEFVKSVDLLLPIQTPIRVIVTLRSGPAKLDEILPLR
jgi:hypothetical protein